jgi:hypothetical protein
VKYLCDACDRLVEPAFFALDDAELSLTCSRCGAETRAQNARVTAEPVAARQGSSSSPAASPASAPARVVPIHAVPPPTFGGDDPFAVPDGRCPKCVAPRPESAQACNQCGLVFANHVPSEQQLSAELAEAWRALAASWGDPEAHDLALSGATARGELAAMGRLYRIRLARQPMDPIAQRGRDEVLRLAASTAPLASMRPASDHANPSPERWRRAMAWGFVALLGVALALMGWQLFTLVRQPPPPP